MSVSVIEGRILEAPVRFSRKGVVRYGHLEFARRDGAIERIGSPVTTDRIAALIAPGAEGRFYLYKVLDVKGIHGVRLADGGEQYDYPGNNAGIFAGAVAIGLAWNAVRIFGYGDVSLTGALVLALGIVGFVMTRNSRAEARRQFDTDAGTLRQPSSATEAAAASAE